MRKERIMKETDFIVKNKSQFLEYFRSKFPAFHNSNVFYRDLRYAVGHFLVSGGFKSSDAELGAILDALLKVMVSDGILREVSAGIWALNYPQFKTTKPGKPVLKF